MVEEEVENISKWNKAVNYENDFLSNYLALDDLLNKRTVELEDLFSRFTLFVQDIKKLVALEYDRYGSSVVDITAPESIKEFHEKVQGTTRTSRYFSIFMDVFNDIIKSLWDLILRDKLESEFSPLDMLLKSLLLLRDNDVFFDLLSQAINSDSTVNPFNREFLIEIAIYFKFLECMILIPADATEKISSFCLVNDILYFLFSSKDCAMDRLDEISFNKSIEYFRDENYTLQHLSTLKGTRALLPRTTAAVVSNIESAIVEKCGKDLEREKLSMESIEKVYEAFESRLLPLSNIDKFYVVGLEVSRQLNTLQACLLLNIILVPLSEKHSSPLTNNAIVEEARKYLEAHASNVITRINTSVMEKLEIFYFPYLEGEDFQTEKFIIDSHEFDVPRDIHPTIFQTLTLVTREIRIATKVSPTLAALIVKGVVAALFSRVQDFLDENVGMQNVLQLRFDFLVIQRIYSKRWEEMSFVQDSIDSRLDPINLALMESTFDNLVSRRIAASSRFLVLSPEELHFSNQNYEYNFFTELKKKTERWRETKLFESVSGVGNSLTFDGKLGFVEEEKKTKQSFLSNNWSYFNN